MVVVVVIVEEVIEALAVVVVVLAVVVQSELHIRTSLLEAGYLTLCSRVPL